jgi:hypothetical protein
MGKNFWIAFMFLFSVAMAQTFAPTAGPTPKATPPTTVDTKKVNINHLNRVQLMALGLSETSADLVLKNRPFQRMSELLKQSIVTPQEFWRIEPKVYAWSPFRGF